MPFRSPVAVPAVVVQEAATQRIHSRCLLPGIYGCGGFITLGVDFLTVLGKELLTHPFTDIGCGVVEFTFEEARGNGRGIRIFILFPGDAALAQHGDQHHVSATKRALRAVDGITKIR